MVGRKRVWSDGTSALVFSPSALVERLVALVPTPMRLAGERPSWSDVLERVFRVDGFACPGCGGPLTLRCVVVNPPATRRFLDGLRRATGPPGPDRAGDDGKA